MQQTTSPAPRTEHRSSLLPLLLPLLLALASALLAPSSLEAQCIFCGDDDEEDPTVAITPAGGTVTTVELDVRVDWCDNQTLDPTSRWIKLNGEDVTSDFTYTNSSGCSVTKRSDGTVELQSGSNTVEARICDDSGNCTTQTANITYEPDFSLAPHSGEYRDVAKCAVDCFDASVAYTTPAYVSLDQPRSLTLVYRSSQADPRGVVLVEVDGGSSPPDKWSVRLQREDGSWVTFYGGSQEIFWQGAGGTRRLGVQFDAEGQSTGVRRYKLVVRAWSGSSYDESTGWVRVPVTNEMTSPYGAGWTVAGLQRLHFQTDGIAVTEGDGSVAFFREVSTNNWSSPDGDFTELVKSGSQYERRYPGGTVLTFNSAGRLISVEDRFGNSTSYAYSGGKLTSVTDPAGKQITLGYGGDGKLAWIDDPAGRRSTVTINGAGEVTAIEDPGGLDALQATYGGDHRMRHRTDRRGGGWGFAYDFAGTLKADTMPQVVAGGQAQRPVMSFVSPLLKVLANPNTSDGSSSNPAWPKPATVDGNVTDPRGNVTRYRVDRFGAAVWVKEPLGVVTTFSRDDEGRLVQETSPTGATTEYTWDGPDLTKVENLATGRVVNTDYESTYHQPVHVWGDVTEREMYYGADGAMDSLRVGNSPAVTEFDHDGRGRVVTRTDPEGHTTAFFYAGGGHQNTDSVAAPGSRVTRFDYDNKGRQIEVTNPEGNVTTTSYDALNRVTQTVGPLNNTTSFTYDALYRTQVTDAEGQSWSYDLNALGWVTQRTDPRGKTDSYSYDLNGNLTENVDRRGETVTFGYDARNVMTSRTADGSTTTFGYDFGQRIRWAQNSVSVDTVKFHQSGRVTDRISRRDGDRYRLYYFYDGQDRITKVNADPGHSVSYSYHSTSNGRLKSIDPSYAGATELDYNFDHLATSVAFPNNDTLYRQHPSTHVVADLKWSDGSLDAAFGTSNTQDLLERKSRQFWTGSDTARAYSYDAGGRLSGYSDEELTTGNCGGSWDPHQGVGCNDPQWNVVESTSLSYDKVGNRTDSGAQVGNGNRLLAFDGYTLTWDDAGNLIQKSGNGVNQQFFWSATGRLDSVSTGSGTVRYGYDAFGRRVRVEGPGGTREYIYDGDDIHLELNGAGNVVAKYAYYPGVDRPHSMRRGGTTYYFATDRLETILGLFNSSGNVVNQYRYTPFGTAESATEGVENPLRYTAREYDATTELYYYRARFYDPALGRFISEDPIGLEGGINPYAYAGNDPVNARDPMGLCHAGVNPHVNYDINDGIIPEICNEGATDGEDEEDGGGEPWDDRTDGSTDAGPDPGPGRRNGGVVGSLGTRTVDIGEQYVRACRRHILLTTVNFVGDVSLARAVFRGAVGLASLVRNYRFNQSTHLPIPGSILKANRADIQKAAGAAGRDVAETRLRSAATSAAAVEAGGFLDRLKSFAEGLLPFRGTFENFNKAKSFCDPE